jgi:NAD+--asparagine ADP-ribosyltransferase
MAELSQAQKNQLKALMREVKRLKSRLQAIHKKTEYEDLGHGVLALQIAEHTVEETLEHTGLSGEIQHKPNPKTHRQAKQWQKIVKDLRVQGDKFLKTHPSEDLETALKALEIAEGSLEEVAEHYESTC